MSLVEEESYSKRIIWLSMDKGHSTKEAIGKKVMQRGTLMSKYYSLRVEQHDETNRQRRSTCWH